MHGSTDLHLDPYYGDEDETEALYSSQAKRETTTFHAYATLCARVRNKRYTLAVRQVVAGETTSDVLAEFLQLLDGLDLGVKAVYLDRGFYNSTCLTLLYAHNYAYVMPMVKWGKTIQNELNRGWSREAEHGLAGEMTFPVFIDCVYQQGRYDEHGVARHGFAADSDHSVSKIIFAISSGRSDDGSSRVSVCWSRSCCCRCDRLSFVPEKRQ